MTIFRERSFMIVVALLAAGAVLPWGLSPSGLTHDHTLHWTAAEAWRESWVQGTIWPPYFDGVNLGLGSAWPSFYPPIYHVLCALGLSYGLNYWWAACLTYALSHSIGSVLTYNWLRCHVSPKAALLGAIAFAFSPWCLLNVYQRGAFPEGVAMEWLPGVLWGCDSSSVRWNWKTAVLGMSSFALITLTNLPATVVASCTVGVYMIAVSGAAVDARVALRALLIPTGGLLLSAFFIMPTWLDKGTVVLPQSSLLLPAGEIVPTAYNQHFHITGHFRTLYGYRGVIDSMIYSFIFIVQIVILLMLCVPRVRKIKAVWPALAMMTTGLVLNLELSAPFYRALPVLGAIQFPLRFLSASWIASILLFALLMQYLECKTMRVIIMVLWATGSIAIYESRRPIDFGQFGTKRSFLGDYVPLGATIPFTEAFRIPVLEYASDRASCHVATWRPGLHVVDVDSGSGFTLILGSYFDSRWHAADQDGHPLVMAFQPGDYWGRMSVEVPNGTRRVVLSLQRSQAAFLGEAITVGFVVTLVASGLRHKAGTRIGGRDSYEVN